MQAAAAGLVVGPASDAGAVEAAERRQRQHSIPHIVCTAAFALLLLLVLLLFPLLMVAVAVVVVVVVDVGEGDAGRVSDEGRGGKGLKTV